MNTQEIEIFITIAETKNISKASKLLFMSQSTVSSQLKSLEEELRIQLFQRQKGSRAVVLTEKGSSFLKMARSMLSLYDDSMALQQHNHCTISFASTDSLNNYLFAPFYSLFTQKYRNVDLRVHTYNSIEILDLVEARVADFGVLFSSEKRDNLIVEPYIREKRYIALNKKSPVEQAMQVINPAELDFSKEVCMWLSTTDYNDWRNRWCTPRDSSGYVRVWTTPLMLRLLDHEGLWGTVSESMLPELRMNENITICALTDPPPARVAYKVKAKYPIKSKEKYLQIFEQQMDEFIKQKGFLIEN